MTGRVMRNDADALCTLTLNRPDKLNALDASAFEELDAHLAALENETGRIGCVVLRGAGRSFCAGADLNAMGAVPVPLTFKAGVIERLGLLPQPLIAAIHGVCYTGGLELALACDFILADVTAHFADTHGKWGLVDMLAPAGGLQALVAGFAVDVLANSWHTNMATMRLLRETDGMSLAQGLAHEQHHHPGFAPDYNERIARFSRIDRW